MTGSSGLATRAELPPVVVEASVYASVLKQDYAPLQIPLDALELRERARKLHARPSNVAGRSS